MATGNGVTNGVTKEAEFAAAAAAAGEMLRAPEPAWDEVERTLVEPIRWLSQLTPTDHAQMDPFLLVNALEAVSATYVALETEDRREARLAVERLRQTLNDMAESAPVGATADAAEVVRWLDAQLAGASMAELGRLLGISSRSWQRWMSGEAEPRGEPADRVRALAQVVAHLRHALTPAGCVRWLERPHPDLAGRRPAELLADAVEHRRLIDLAAGTRVSAAA